MKYLLVLFLLSGCGLILSKTFYLGDKVKVTCGFFNGHNGTVTAEGFNIMPLSLFQSFKYRVDLDDIILDEYIASNCLERI